MQRLTLLTLALIATVKVFTQVGIGTTDPHEHAALHIKGDGKGLLIPVVDQRNSLPDISEVRPGLLYYIEKEHAFVYADSVNATTRRWQSATPFDTDISTGKITMDENYTVINAKFEGSVSGNLDASGSNTFSGNGTVPVGGIIMWSGVLSRIPAGWALCDGRTKDGIKTPDLRGRFVVGYGADSVSHGSGGVDPDIWDNNYKNPGNLSDKKTSEVYQGGYQGNSDNEITIKANNLPQHWHTGETYGSEDGKHNHIFKDAFNSETYIDVADPKWNIWGIQEKFSDDFWWTGFSGGGRDNNNNYFHTLYRSSDYRGFIEPSTGQPDERKFTDFPNWPGYIVDGHSHTIQTNTTKTGSSVSSANTTNQAIDIRPPYYVLAFIMRTK